VAANGIEAEVQRQVQNSDEMAGELLDAGTEVDAWCDAFGGQCTMFGLACFVRPFVRGGVAGKVVTLLCASSTELRDETRADVILMDLQYVPALLTPAQKDKAITMVEAISKLAGDANGVNVFGRFAFMKGLHQVEQASRPDGRRGG
jgi:hypothetical protein